jgi:ABC-type microcin C transport system permease subunit YejB
LVTLERARMLRQVMMRLATTLVTLFGVAVIVFVVIRVVPGDPVAMMLPAMATPEDIARLRTLYGLDKSIGEQFVIWGAGCCRVISAPRSPRASRWRGWCWAGCPRRWSCR